MGGGKPGETSECTAKCKLNFWFDEQGGVAPKMGAGRVSSGGGGEGAQRLMQPFNVVL